MGVLVWTQQAGDHHVVPIVFMRNVMSSQPRTSKESQPSHGQNHPLDEPFWKPAQKPVFDHGILTHTIWGKCFLHVAADFDTVFTVLSKTITTSRRRHRSTFALVRSGGFLSDQSIGETECTSCLIDMELQSLGLQ